MTIENITAIFKELETSIHTINPVLSYDDIAPKFTALCEAIEAFTGDTEEWCYIGEHGYCCIDDLLIGAFWHFTEWHKGQSSLSYAALSALGGIYTPNMECAPTDQDDSGFDTYDLLNDLATAFNKK
ncbi:hypothetical protein COPG_00010 [Colwellia phage 9A]|uniref:Uncharacterized protein n=1 Tax=Colwellia phage 9A TaxID=765765 RepID=I3UM91_9CAUD|nr:hypothetical protein COPG_00010 [Colwellia phage 9A]AFK66606.1 hypothetical protein COPG_00010 [Colwellia phage 9A]